MKTITKITLSVIAMFALMAFASMTRPTVVAESLIELEPKPVVYIEPYIPIIKIELKAADHLAFLDELGQRESSGNYSAVNKFGYLGKYQFGRKTLNSLGYKKITSEEFLYNHSLQEEAMLALLIHNKNTLRREIKKLHGTKLHGILITESGLLAAAHLAGPGNVKKWIRRGRDFKDGLGTSMTSYMVKFSGYSLEL